MRGKYRFSNHLLKNEPDRGDTKNTSESSKLTEGVIYRVREKMKLKNFCDEKNRLLRREKINKKLNEYINSFTVHGLTKVFNSKRYEAVFWATMLIIGILSSVVIIHGLVSKYLRFGVYTEIRSQVTDQNVFPSVTFCENQLLVDTYFSYCGVPPRIKHNDSKVPCRKRFHMASTNISTKKGAYWSNGLFNVTKCESWGGKKCANDKYFKSSLHLNHSCIIWNYNGDLHDIYSHVDIEFEFVRPATLHHGTPVIIAVPHDPEVHEVDITSKVDIETGKNYEIKLDKTLIRRLPTPYPSNCTRSKNGDIFPGKFTRRSCIESHNYIEMFKKCGDTLDYIRQYIPKHIIRTYGKNLTIRQAEICIWLFGQGETKANHDCPFPCEELDLGIISTFNERRRIKSQKYHVSVQYQHVDTFKVMEEKELYSWDQLACEIGGLIGLVIGASFISLVEILASIFLVIAKRLLN